MTEQSLCNCLEEYRTEKTVAGVELERKLEGFVINVAIDKKLADR